MILYYGKIGQMSNGKTYYFNVPYNSSEKFVKYISDEKDNIAKNWFGYERDKIVETMYAVQFHICDTHGFDPDTFEDRREYNIHYHMMSTEDYQECYNPTLSDENKKELRFLSIEDACEFLIKFMEDYELTEINTEEITKDIQSTTKEVKRYMSILNRITDALNYR